MTSCYYLLFWLFFLSKNNVFPLKKNTYVNYVQKWHLTHLFLWDFSCLKGIGARSSSVITFSLKSVGNHQERKMYLKHLGDQFYLTIVKNSFRWLLDFESTGVLPSDAALLSLRVSSESSAAATGKRSSKDRISLWSVSEDTECSVNWTIRDSGLLGGGERLWWLKPLCPWELVKVRWTFHRSSCITGRKKSQTDLERQ